VPPALALFDLDRTVTRAGTYTPFLLHCMGLRPGAVLKALAAAVTYKLGGMTRDALKARMLEVSIAGASRAQVTAWAESFVSACSLRPGAKAAIARHKAAGDRLVLATASFDFYVQVFAKHLGFDDIVATVSVWDEKDCLRAALDGDNCYGAAKVVAVKRYLAAHPASRITAYSDHHTDFEFLRMADEGIAVNPNAKLRKLAQAHGLPIVDWERM
jgi:phosphatidylglycerophosphatase C